jgi:hypothetical protein
MERPPDLKSTIEQPSQAFTAFLVKERVRFREGLGVII